MGKLGSISFNSDTCGFTLVDIANALNQVDNILDDIAEGNPFNGTVTAGAANAFTLDVAPNTIGILDKGFILLKANRTNTSASIMTISVNGETAKKAYIMNNTGIVTTKGGEFRLGHHYLIRKETALDGGAGGYVILNPSLSIPTAVGVPGLTANVATVFSAITWDHQNFAVDSEAVNFNIGVRFTMAAPLPTQIYITIPHASVVDAGLNAAGNIGYECFAREAGATLAAKVVWWCDVSGRIRCVKESGAAFAAGAACLFLQGRVRSA